MASEVDYFFRFASEHAALSDPVVGPYLSQYVILTDDAGNFLIDDYGNILTTGDINPAYADTRQNIWAYDLVNTATPVSGWECMIAQSSPVSALQTHSKLTCFLLLPADVLFMAPDSNAGLPVISKASYAANWALLQ